ncbi:sulfate permease-like protein [Encephalitozoon intestinalis ATCC 50506]|uniref:Sulfate permease-like protein n=1 Tax=Encephalitozoon intestinalis (strain ATCC 50506) TaxID=876142 RepID=E0S8I7_ENCIT|nr:sulfate permease-like protein [Encephalitozoon intestinalis ATCC 50506]ADM11981.1 sulfate permease-like protein [Encephalitozoon intestinalis ATCC 50506]UTX45767.1 sulfate transporter protein [Encephalitozoon intestinalis]
MKSVMKTAKQKILSLISSSFLLFTMTSLDLLSFGTKLLSTENSHNKNIGNVSAMMFLYSTIASQFVFGLFSKLGGIAAGAIFEAQKDTRRIHKVCFKMSSTFGEEISTTYACIFLSTILFAFFSYVLKTLKIGSNLKYIPIPALYGVMVSIGAMSIECGFEEVYSITWKYVHVCLAVTIVLALLAVVLDILFPEYFLMIPMFSFSIFAVFYLVFLAAGKDIEWMKSVGLIPKAGGIDLNPLETLKHLKIENIKIEAVKANLMNILGLSLFNLVHIAVNVPSFAETFGINADLNKELGVQSIGNIVSAFFGYPTYFICSTSIYFNKSGGRSRIHSFVGAIAMSSLLVIGGPIRERIPTILSGTIPMFIGFGFLYSYLWTPILKLSWVDLLTLVMSSVVSWFLTPIFGLVFGMLFNSFFVLWSHLFTTKVFHSKLGETIRISRETTEEMYRVVDLGPLTSFGNLSESVKAMKVLCKENVLFDLRSCMYFGANANMALEEVAGAIEENGNQVLMIGSPQNLYTHLFSKYMADLPESELSR